MAIAKRTDPAPKYGPTAEYGECEAGECAAVARASCPSCDGDFCLGHRAHEVHEVHVAAANR